MSEIELAILKLKRIKEVVECGTRYSLSPQEVLRVIQEQGDLFYDDILEILTSELDRQENPLTWNERISQMTVEEKAGIIYRGCPPPPSEKLNYGCDVSKECSKCWIAFLNSPYTEGEKE